MAVLKYTLAILLVGLTCVWIFPEEVSANPLPFEWSDVFGPEKKEILPGVSTNMDDNLARDVLTGRRKLEVKLDSNGLSVDAKMNPVEQVLYDFGIIGNPAIANSPSLCLTLISFLLLGFLVIN